MSKGISGVGFLWSLVSSRSWFGREKKIRWEDIASLHFNSGNRQFTVRANDGRKISHAGFNVDPATFQTVIHERTRLPLKVTKPGTWKSETFEVPYEEFRPEEEQEGAALSDLSVRVQFFRGP